MANSLIDFGVIQPEIALQPFERARQQARQEQANQLAALQLKAAQRGEEEALAAREAYKSADPVQALFAAGLGPQAIGAAKALQEQKSAQLKQAQDAHKTAKEIVNSIIAIPTRENATNVLDNAEKKLGIDLSQYRAELGKTSDADIQRWAFTHGVGADKALEQAIIQLPGGGTAVEPKYALGGAPIAATMPSAAPAAMAAPMAAPAMPAGIPGQTPPTRANMLAQAAIPAPGMPTGAMPTPTGGRYYPPAMTPQQQAAEARAQRSLALQEQAASPEFQQRMAAAKETGQETAKKAVAKQELMKQIDSTSKELEAITKKGGLIDQSTGSLIGRGVDIAAGALGKATPGAMASAQLAPIANMVLMMVPRFEGPQSDKDTQTYKEAAGRLADPTLPADIRKAAGQEILRLFKARRDQFSAEGMETPGVSSAPVSTPTKRQFSGQDQQALDWANANPNDPRSVKIKQKLGVQ